MTRKYLFHFLAIALLAATAFFLLLLDSGYFEKPAPPTSSIWPGDFRPGNSFPIAEEKQRETPDESLRPIGELLKDWNEGKRVTIDVADAPLKQVMEDITKQAGIVVSSWHKDPKITLKLEDQPLWKALAETSIQAKLPIWLFGEKEVRFDEIADHVYERYQILGPFLVGIHTAPVVIELVNVKSPSLVIHAESFPMEGQMRRYPGISEAFLLSPQDKPVALERVEVSGKQISGRGYFIVPPELLKMNLTLRAKFDGEVFFTPQEVVVPIVEGETTDFKHFGGIKVRIDRVTAKAVEYSVEWDAKLRGTDAEKLEQIEKRTEEVLQGKGKPGTLEEQREFEDWLHAKASEMRLLSKLQHELLDKNQKVIERTIESSISSIVKFRGKISHKENAAPANLSIVLAERKVVVGYVEFDNVFSVGSK